MGHHAGITFSAQLPATLPDGAAACTLCIVFSYKDYPSLLYSASDEKRVSQWEMLMRKFSEAHKEECRSVTLDIPRVKRAEKTFPTGSSYTGTWDVLGMSGFGTYRFPNGVVYEGEFDDGTFHGRGELRYPSGAVIYGKWRQGEMLERMLVFPDGLPYSEEDWPYCTMPDRRFTIEIDSGIEPAGESYITAEQPTRDIPHGFYDTGDGFYDPEAKVVLSAADSSRIIRKPSLREQKWIIENCRTSPMKPLGPRPDLYEEWCQPRTVAEEQEPNPPSQQSFRSSRSKIRMFYEDRDSDAGQDENNSNETQDEESSSNETLKSRVAMARGLLTFYDKFPVEYLEKEIEKK